MICEDFVMLGKTVPEASADGRQFVCSAGWSDEMRSLIRVYPLAMRGAPPMWSRSVVSLERNPKDHRAESWRLRGERQGDCHRDINKAFQDVQRLPHSEILSLCERLPVTSKVDANEARLSLAVVQPDAPPLLEFSENAEADDHPQMRLFETDPEAKIALGAKRFPYQPRLRFSIEGKPHDLQLREWGAYEWMRKRGPEGRFDHPVWEQLKRNPRLLIGNMNGRRNVWLVISVLRHAAQIDMFASSNVPSLKADGVQA